MAANAHQVAREWARHGISNPRFAAALSQRYNAMMTQSIAEGGLDKVTSATKNGVSMAKQVGLSVPDAMTAMGQALAWIESGIIPVQSRAFGRF